MHRHLPYERSERVAETLFQIISKALRGELTDPRLAGVEITRVSLTKDLRTARVCYHVAGDPNRRASADKGLRSAAGYMKRKIGDEVELRFMPEIEFFYDEGVDTGERIEELLREARSAGRGS